MSVSMSSTEATSATLRSALELYDLGLWPVAIRPGQKAPIGEKWGARRPTRAELIARFEANPGAGVGLKLGAAADVVDFEIDGEGGEDTLAEMFMGEVVETRGWTSKRGSHRLFRYDDRFRKYGKSIIKVGGLEIRIGELQPGDKQLQSVVPPTATDGVARQWFGPSEIADVPDAVFVYLDAMFPQASAPAPPQPAAPVTLPLRAYGHAPQSVESRAIAYLAKCDPAVSGRGGHDKTFSVACKVGPGFDLTPDQAFRLLWEHYNPRCEPPWSEQEIRHKVEDAYQVETRRGWLRDAPTKETKETKKGGLNSFPTVNSSPTHEIEEPVVAREWPAPPAEEAWFGPAGEFARAVDPYTEADPLGILASILLGFGSMLGRTVVWKVGATFHYPNLNACTVGKTAAGRKGTAWDEAERLLAKVAGMRKDRWAEDRIHNGLSSGEGLVGAVRDPQFKQVPIKEKGRIAGYQSEMVDEGVDDKRLMVVESELARTFKVMVREGNTLSALVRQAWDGKNLGTMTKQPVKATAPHVSILGHITEAELVRYLSDIEASNGFGNRFLWLLVKRSKLLPNPKPLPPRILDEFVGRLHDCYQFHAARVEAEGGCYELARDPEADAIWVERYAGLNVERPGLLGSLLSRGAPIVMRLAMLYAVLDRSACIAAVHLRAALALWEYSERSAAFIFGETMGDKDADQILSALHANPEGLTQTQINHDVFGGNFGAKKIAGALTRLLEAGLIRSEKVATGGRPATRWFSVAHTKETEETKKVGSVDESVLWLVRYMAEGPARPETVFRAAEVKGYDETCVRAAFRAIGGQEMQREDGTWWLAR